LREPTSFPMANESILYSPSEVPVFVRFPISPFEGLPCLDPPHHTRYLSRYFTARAGSTLIVAEYKQLFLARIFLTAGVLFLSSQPPSQQYPSFFRPPQTLSLLFPPLRVPRRRFPSTMAGLSDAPLRRNHFLCITKLDCAGLSLLTTVFPYFLSMLSCFRPLMLAFFCCIAVGNGKLRMS